MFERRVAHLAKAGTVQRAAGNRLIDVEIAVADLDIEATIGVCARPGFEVDRGALAAKIGKRNEVAALTLLALWE